MKKTEAILSSIFLTVIIVAMVSVAHCQVARQNTDNTFVAGKTQSFLGVVDFSSSTGVAPCRTGSGAPTGQNGTRGQCYYQTGATAGHNLWWATTTGTPATWTLQANSGGTVTTVGFTGGLISVASPTTTPAFTVAGTSGGIPYFSSSSTWASSTAPSANLPMIWGGAGAAPGSGTKTGTGVQFVMDTSPTIITPTIASFLNSTHSHTNAAGGGTLDTSAIGSGILGSAFGGTNNGFFAIAGPASTTKTHTWPNASIDWTALTGVLKISTGTPSVVTGTSTNCVKVDGSSGVCGGLSQAVPYMTESSAYYIGFPLRQVTLPDATTWAWVNQGGASETADGHALILAAPGAGGTQVRMRTVAIGANTTATAAVAITALTVNYNMCGLALYETSSGKITGIGLQINAVNNSALSVTTFNSTTSFGSNLANYLGFGTSSNYIWLRVKYDGVDVSYWYSGDGSSWQQVFTQAKAAFFTTNPDKFGYFCNAEHSTIGNSIELLSFLAN